MLMFRVLLWICFSMDHMMTTGIVSAEAGEGTPSLIYVGLVLCCAAPAGVGRWGQQRPDQPQIDIFSAKSQLPSAPRSQALARIDSDGLIEWWPQSRGVLGWKLILIEQQQVTSHHTQDKNKPYPSQQYGLCKRGLVRSHLNMLPIHHIYCTSVRSGCITSKTSKHLI